MLQNMIWSITNTSRGLGLDTARGEPSHIHLPRRRRIARTDDQGNSPSRGVDVGDEERHGHAPPAADET